MAVPPPFPGERPKKSNTTRIVLILLAVIGLPCIAIVAVLGVLGYRVAQTVSSELQPAIQCGVTLNLIRDSLKAYARENGGKLPQAATWEDDVRPFYAQELKDSKNQVPSFIAPISAEGQWGCQASDQVKTGIAFNKELSGKKLQDLKGTEVLIFEVENPGKNLSQVYKERKGSPGGKILGKERPWLFLPVSGDGNIDAALSQGDNVNVRINEGENPSQGVDVRIGPGGTGSETPAGPDSEGR